jgi:hypothetical protein
VTSSTAAPIIRVSDETANEEREVPNHTCDTGDFDRNICPDPCGYMHSYCATCGVRQDPCAHETTDQTDSLTDSENTP